MILAVRLDSYQKLLCAASCRISAIALTKGEIDAGVTAALSGSRRRSWEAPNILGRQRAYWSCHTSQKPASLSVSNMAKALFKWVASLSNIITSYRVHWDIKLAPSSKRHGHHIYDRRCIEQIPQKRWLGGRSGRRSDAYSGWCSRFC